MDTYHGAGWVAPAPASQQSLSPFESRSTTLAVLWSVLLISTMVLTVCWIFWV